MKYSDDAMREAAAAMIIAKRDALVIEQAALNEQRSEILGRLRRVDRELADCRAAARLFNLEIEFPVENEGDGAAALKRRTEQLLEQTQAWTTSRLALRNATLRNAVAHSVKSTAMHDIDVAVTVPQTKLTETNEDNMIPSQILSSTKPSTNRPALRHILIEQLKLAGTSGAKASELRDFFERAYGEIIHEKTVGMTLYRLLRDGSVHRNGHTWFFGPAQQTSPIAGLSVAKPENPGAVTPGPTQPIG